ncbi:MAG: hypothetical protein R2854_16415 [Caldilineaceae bacterium]
MGGQRLLVKQQGLRKSGVPTLTAKFPSCIPRELLHNKLDWKLEEVIDFRGGFFDEAGANDGVHRATPSSLRSTRLERNFN